MFWNLKRVAYSLLLVLATIQGKLSFADTLEENSPFIPFDYVSGPVEVPIGPSRGGVELRGILDFGDEPRFSLYNTKTQESVWVDFKDQEAPYYIDSYDPQKRMVAITVNGVRQQLKVSKPSDEPGGGAARGLRNGQGSSTMNQNLDDDEEDEDDEEEDEGPSEDELSQKRREMSEKVYKAFQQYVSQKRGEAGS